MSCEKFENSILDYQENQLSPGQRQEMESHLAGCAGCRIFARQLQQLDKALSATVKVRALSAGFDRRLQKRIHAAPAVLSAAQRAERKEQFQVEFETGLARIGRGSFAVGGLMKHLTWPALAVAAGWLVWRITLQLTAHLNAQSLGGLDPHLLPWLVASIVCLGVGLAEVFPRQWKFPEVQ